MSHPTTTYSISPTRYPSVRSMLPAAVQPRPPFPSAFPTGPREDSNLHYAVFETTLLPNYITGAFHTYKAGRQCDLHTADRASPMVNVWPCSAYPMPTLAIL